MRQPETNDQIFLIDGIISDIAAYLVEDKGISVDEALAIIYESDYYDQLNNLDTELYLRGSLNNYHYLCQELKNRQ